MGIRGRVFTACAIGGGVGAFLAHQLFYPSGWSVLLGFLVGGLVGYLAYDFRGFLAAISKAWNKTVGEMLGLVPFFVVLIIMASHILTVVSVRALDLPQETTEVARVILTFMLVFGFVVSIFRLIINEGLYDSLNERDRMIYLLKWFNPFTVILVVVPHSIFLIVKYSILFLPRFFWNIFVLIHSELRLLCLLDGGMGAVAGTLIAGTLAGTLVGALAGGIFGVLNYEIISKRVLKLISVK